VTAPNTLVAIEVLSILYYRHCDSEFFASSLPGADTSMM
jgi:hypothetical protein